MRLPLSMMGILQESERIAGGDCYPLHRMKRRLGLPLRHLPENPHDGVTVPVARSKTLALQ